jgi:hypothetical protein
LMSDLTPPLLPPTSIDIAITPYEPEVLGT